MPKRETISIEAEGDASAGAASPLRATIVRPDQAATGKSPLILIHRGLAFTEDDIDFLDRLADAIAEAGMIAVMFEPRAMGLILDDFHAFSLDHSIADLRRMLEQCGLISGVDASRIGLAVWSFGATAAVEAARMSPTVSRMCLMNPATPAFIVHRAQKAAASANPVDADALPRAVVEKLAAMVEAKTRPSLSAPTLIVHAAADRTVPAHVSHEFLPQAGESSPSIERVLIARADHAFTDPIARQACVDRVVTHFSKMTPIVAAPKPVGAGA